MEETHKEEMQTGQGEDLTAGLRVEFLEDTGESLRDLQHALDSALGGKKPAAEFLMETRRVALLLKGQAANVGAHLITVVAHRLEDYLTNVEELDERAGADLQVFLDILTNIAEGKTELDANPAVIVRSLPAKPGFDFDLADLEVRDVEVMLVMLRGAATRFVERELQQCGYRITNVASTFEALPMIIHTKPNMIVISAVLPDLSGIDLAIALASMPETRNTPVALITSFDRDHESLHLLPANVPVIQKGPSFGDDLVEALDNAFLL